MNALSPRTRSARNSAAKRVLIRRLCTSLDLNVARAESFPAGGKTRARYMAKAESFRKRLRAIDH